jgi:hypothetical protein
MSGLVVGDTVSIACPICASRMKSHRLTCGVECVRELRHRQRLDVAGKAYEIDPESRMGKLADAEAEPARVVAP